jgi:hypothetical protein
VKDQFRFRILVAATVVILALVLVSSQCSGDGESADGVDTTVPAVEPAAATPPESTAGTDPEPVTTLAPRPGDPAAPLADPAATGRELSQRFLDILSQRDPRPALEEFLSPSFQLQRSNGTFADREEYLNAPASVVRATILPDGFRAYQDGPVLTVRFTVDVQETVGGESLPPRQADRLAVFRRGADGWKLVAWANFNPA